MVVHGKLFKKLEVSMVIQNFNDIHLMVFDDFYDVGVPITTNSIVMIILKEAFGHTGGGYLLDSEIERAEVVYSSVRQVSFFFISSFEV